MPYLRFGIKDKVTGFPGFVADTSLIDSALGKRGNDREAVSDAALQTRAGGSPSFERYQKSSFALRKHTLRMLGENSKLCKMEKNQWE